MLYDLKDYLVVRDLCGTQKNISLPHTASFWSSSGWGCTKTQENTVDAAKHPKQSYLSHSVCTQAQMYAVRVLHSQPYLGLPVAGVSNPQLSAGWTIDPAGHVSWRDGT